jgi:hypothetical protein
MAPLMVLYMIDGEYLIAVGILMFYMFFAAILRNIYLKGIKPRYPLGIRDPDNLSFPRTNIPRPIFKDLREHPEYFEKENKRKTDEIN